MECILCYSDNCYKTNIPNEWKCEDCGFCWADFDLDDPEEYLTPTEKLGMMLGH